MNAQPYDDWTAQLAQWAQEYCHVSGRAIELAQRVEVLGDAVQFGTYVAPDV